MNNDISKLKKLFQKRGNILKIVSNPIRGSIKIYDKKGKLLFKKTNLSKDQVTSIEDNLLGYITNKLNTTNKTVKKESYDPMVA